MPWDVSGVRWIGETLCMELKETKDDPKGPSTSHFPSSRFRWFNQAKSQNLPLLPWWMGGKLDESTRSIKLDTYMDHEFFSMSKKKNYERGGSLSLWGASQLRSFQIRCLFFGLPVSKIFFWFTQFWFLGPDLVAPFSFSVPLLMIAFRKDEE